jgi:hypothetical protein
MIEDPDPSNRDYALCAACGRLTHIDDLDAKPDNINAFARPETLLDWLMLFFRPKAWRIEQLERTADRGAQFERLECGACYGPGYVSLRAR